MTIIPALDLRDHDEPAGPPHQWSAPMAKLLAHMPMNVNLEMALLGALLFDSSALHGLPAGFGPDHFGEPVMGRLFDSIRYGIETGGFPDVALIWAEMQGDPALLDLGGFRFLADLIDRAPPAVNAPEYAKKIMAIATRREIIHAGVTMALQAGERDKDDMESSVIIAEADKTLLELRARDRRDDTTTLDEAIEGTNAYVDDRTQAVGIRTGIVAVDRVLGPIMAGELIVCGGATGMGKSALGIAIAQNVADPELAARIQGVKHDPQQKPRGVIEIMAEMTFGDGRTGGQAVRRHMADVGYHMFGRKFPTYSAIKAKDVSVEQRAMMTEVQVALHGMPIVGISRTGVTIDKIKAICLRQFIVWEKQGIEPGLLVIDHMGLVRARKPQNRTADQTEVAIDSKAMAKDLGIPVLALVQVNRGPSKADDKRPTLNDLKDSGEWENSADAVLLAYRDSYYAKREQEPDEAKIVEWSKWDARCRSKELEIILPKVREGEGGSSAKVWTDIAWNAVRGAEPQGADGFI